MLSFLIENGQVADVSSLYKPGWLNRTNIKSFEQAQAIATSTIELTKDRYVAVDSGPSVSPRYDVVKAPKVGDKVSYAFNGDYYPDGEIVSVSPTLIVKTSGGHTYRRRKLTAAWQQPGGTWSLVHGHVDKRNPSF